MNKYVIGIEYSIVYKISLLHYYIAWFLKEKTLGVLLLFITVEIITLMEFILNSTFFFTFFAKMYLYKKYINI